MKTYYFKVQIKGEEPIFSLNLGLFKIGLSEQIEESWEFDVAEDNLNDMISQLNTMKYAKYTYEEIV